MSNYNSENTHVLATHMNDDNERMLLLHVCGDGHLQYIIGSYFEKKPGYGGLEGIIVDRCGATWNVETGCQVGFATNLADYDDPAYYDQVLEHANVVHYSWDWGHYFSDVVSAVRYWEREVLGTEERGGDGIEG